MSVLDQVKKIEEALARSLRGRGCDVVVIDGHRFVRFYGTGVDGTPELVRELSIVGIATDIERALS